METTVTEKKSNYVQDFPEIKLPMHEIDLQKQLTLSECFINELLNTNIILASSVETLNFFLHTKKLDKKTYRKQKKLIVCEFRHNLNLLEIHSGNLHHLKQKIKKCNISSD